MLNAFPPSVTIVEGHSRLLTEWSLLLLEPLSVLSTAAPVSKNLPRGPRALCTLRISSWSSEPPSSGPAIDKHQVVKHTVVIQTQRGQPIAKSSNTKTKLSIKHKVDKHTVVIQTPSGKSNTKSSNTKWSVTYQVIN